ncbi:MAG TPA: sigma-70 family RNA polymerase sigma factor [Pyrinomonadaceae bacterium]|jgi:RNA polymerase sigma factor (sigma-70 family)|nr:sigma-70 family RNA polymerase sigma factor [Pyrinomonadaceae bacterium]
MKDHISEKDIKLKASRLQKTDADLLLACRRGEQTAWDELVERFQRLVSTVPRRAGLSEEQAADIFQEVFLTLFQKMDEIEQPDKLRSWLVTTAKFKTWNIIRGEKEFTTTSTGDTGEDEVDILSLIPDDSPLADKKLIELEEQHLVRTALKELEERCRTILSMLYLSDEGASYAEVAKVVNVSETSISPLRARCLKKLSQILEK